MSRSEKKASAARLSEIFPLIEEKLKSGGMVTFKPNGTSMLPMLRPGIDSVTIKRVEKLNKNDVILYKRQDGSFVLHRIIAKEKDGYVLRGDNQWFCERGITDDMVIGTLIEFTRTNKKVSCKSMYYRAYVKSLWLVWLWCWTKSVFKRAINKIKR